MDEQRARGERECAGQRAARPLRVDRSGWSAAIHLLVVALVGCAYDDSPSFGNADPQEGVSGIGGASGTSGTSGTSGVPPARCGENEAALCDDGRDCIQNADCVSRHCEANVCVAPTHDDHIQNGDETDIDCGGATATACAPGQGCVAPRDCDSGVCTANRCAAPSPNDGIQNGDETDVDCGGTNAPGCELGGACLVHDDCKSDACDYQHKCVEYKGCTAHEGGDTCGAGEVDDPARQHENCCVELPLPSGAQLDKYLVTAGRMRAFIERTGGDVAGWIAQHKPAWWDAEYGSVSLPTDVASANYELSAEGASAGCFVGGGGGGRTYWLSEADNDLSGSGRQAYPREVLDTKALNCVRRPMLAALCAWDGKRVPTRAQQKEAWGDADYPWGNQAWNANLAVHKRTYFWPQQQLDPDQAYHIAAPGRRPLGNGPQGHADLAALLFEHGTGGVGLSSGSFEGHAISKGGGSITFTINRKYWAIGGRCARY